MNIPAIIAMIIMIIFAALNLIVPIKILKKENSETKGYKKTRGKVVEYIERFSYVDRSHQNYPVVVYKVDNREYKIISEVSYIKSFFMPKKLNVLYNPANPAEAKVTNKSRLMLNLSIAFSFAILLMTHFLVNDLILGNTMKDYTYEATCYISGYKGSEIITKRAKTAEEAKKLVAEKYKNWDATCEYKLLEPEK